MKINSVGAVLALPLLVAACGPANKPGAQNRQGAAPSPGAPQAGDIHSASGKVTAIAGEEITISHGPVESLGWPAMTMSFKAASADMLGGVSVGDQVSFSFTADGGAYALTSLSKDK